MFRTDLRRSPHLTVPPRRRTTMPIIGRPDKKTFQNKLHLNLNLERLQTKKSLCEQKPHTNIASYHVVVDLVCYKPPVSDSRQVEESLQVYHSSFLLVSTCRRQTIYSTMKDLSWLFSITVFFVAISYLQSSDLNVP